MERSGDERLLDLRALVRTRLARDLRSLADILKKESAIPLDEFLEEIHHVYVHYLKQNALLNSATSAIHRDDRKLSEELRNLRSIDL